jgi:hypothetical protein
MLLVRVDGAARTIKDLNRFAAREGLGGPIGFLAEPKRRLPGSSRNILSAAR